MSLKPKLIVLDFDGVIIESNSAKTEAFEIIFAKYPEHQSAMMHFHKTNVSVSRFEKFAHLQQLLGKTSDSDFVASIGAEFSEIMLNRMQSLPLVSGALDFIKYISESYSVYLASVTPEEELTKILKNLDLQQWFKHFYGCPPWIKTDAIRDAMLRESVTAEQTVFIGDSSGDQKVASELELMFIARNSGLEFKEVPAVIFDDLTGILLYFKNQGW